MRRGRRAAVLLASALLVSVPVSHAQTKPAKTRPATSQQTVPAPHWGSTKAVGGKPGAPRSVPKPALCTHTVRRGESIGRIAGRYRVSRTSLINANQLVNPHALRAGQRLSVPDCRPRVQTAVGESPDTEPAADGILIRRVGPRRILTSLVLGEPGFRGEGISLVWPVAGPVISTFGQRSRGWHAGI
ncbi:MAG: LysM peptidoglycan-binding domain-containing protein, partial [Candidatus Rokuibacteriota bacterium]